MALIVEDGTGRSDAESYVSVAEADTYFSNRGYTLWATLLEAEKEQALRRSTDYIGEVYRLRWNGSRVNGTQALDWPRAFVLRDDYEYAGLNGSQFIGGQFYFPSDEVPKQVKDACCYLAFKASQGDLSPEIDRRTIREKVDVIEVEYAEYGPQYVIYRTADNLLAPFLRVKGNAVRGVIRV